MRDVVCRICGWPILDERDAAEVGHLFAAGPSFLAHLKCAYTKHSANLLPRVDSDK